MLKITNTKAGTKLIVTEKYELREGKDFALGGNTELCNCYSAVSASLHDGKM